LLDFSRLKSVQLPEAPHFVDPSLAVGALRATPERLLHDLSPFGLLFESLVVRDLRVYGFVLETGVQVIPIDALGP
jgi:hypothetical protein